MLLLLFRDRMNVITRVGMNVCMIKDDDIIESRRAMPGGRW